jgi:hypothetical protein
MKINRNFLSWVALSLVSIIFFQNCGQQGDIALKLEDATSDTLVQDICAVNPSHVRCTNETPTGKVEEYRYIDVSQPVIPDLKIFLVFDNSDSMRVSQVNLVNNIEKMFTVNSDGLKDYNSEIFIITTAQLNNISNSLFRASVDAKNDYQKVIEKIHEISNVQYVQNLIQVFRPEDNGVRKTTGLLEGDMVGFKMKTTRMPSNVGLKYDVLNVEFSPAYLTHIDQSSILSVKYSKGESIQDLVEKIKARVEFLDPERQHLSKTIDFNGSTVDNVPLSTVVEKESGLCAMARVLHDVKNHPDSSLVKKGELATFILVSDEKEHDPEGLECVKSYKFQQPVPGNLYKGECADTEANVAYAIPSDKTVNFKVKMPYTRHIRQAYEHIEDEITLRNGSCGIKFNQSLARLKVMKNTHNVKFDRKVVDANGDDVVDYWKHDIKFNRVNLKHDLKFDRVNLKHKLTFNRHNKKFNVTANRVHTAPKFAVDIKRKKVAKFQKVSYKRETVLKKEGNQEVIVQTYTTPSPINIAGYNFASPSLCTTDWLRSIPSIASQETTLGANESYRYTVSLCVINNTETNDDKIVDIMGIKPDVANCNTTLAKSVYPEGALAAHESFTYSQVVCSDKASVISNSNLLLSKDGSAPVTCDEAYAWSVDNAKPSVDAGKGETLVYQNVSCPDSSTTDLAQNILNIPGKYSASNLLDYIKLKDGSRANTTYSATSYADTPTTDVGAKVEDIAGAYSAADLNAYVILKDGNKANVEYANEEVIVDNIVDSNVTIADIAGKYTFTTNAALVDYIEVKDGNRTNVEYTNASYVNKPTYKAVLGRLVAIDGKSPVGGCTGDLDYARAHDNTKPALLAGEQLVYSNVSCTATSSTTYQLVRGPNTIKYDGIHGHLAIAYESALGTTVAGGRDCSTNEKNTIISAEASASPALNIDGNILELASANACRVYNSELTASSTAKTNITNAINNDAAVKVSTNASACDTAIQSYCINNSSLNPGNLLFCENKPASYISYRAYKPEYRKYTLKAPVKPDGQNELHWFGFEKISTTNKSGAAIEVDLLSLKCGDVLNACVGMTAGQESMTVLSYFKAKYAGGVDATWNAFSKISFSNSTISDPLAIPACSGTLVPGYTTCRDKSKQVSDYVSYDLADSDINVTKGIDAVVSCNDLCTADTCKTKTGSSFAIPFTGKTMRDFYGNNCAMGAITTGGTASNRSTSAIRLNAANSDNARFFHDVDVCALTCAESGLCKIAANSEVDLTGMTVKQYLALKNQNIDPSKVASCKMVRRPSVMITGKRSLNEVENECTRPAGVVLVNKYLRSKQQYYDADPVALNDVKLVKENDLNLENYIKNSFNNVLGDGYVNMIAFSSKAVDGNGNVVGADYNRIAESVKGQVRDVQAPSSEYGDALKFLGEKVASQLASSFKVVDVDPSQQITRVWYSSWFTKGKFVELSPTDFSASANSFVITNPDIVNKMKNEAAFKFFVEIY